MYNTEKGYRDSEHVIPGFNLAIIDVDGQVDIDTAEWLLSDYKYLIYTTKRHTDKKNRFRIILPMSHKLYLSKADYKEFMENLYEWLPFSVDTQTSDYARKWMTQPGMNKFHDGELIDATLFIPKTKKSEERREIISSQSSLNNMERWFLNHTDKGSRNNHLIRYGLMLVDTGIDYQDVINRVINFNEKLDEKIPEAELHSTIFQTVGKAIATRDK